MEDNISTKESVQESFSDDKSKEDSDSAQGFIQNEGQNIKQERNYKHKEYWNERYKSKDTTYDWYCSYPELKEIFQKCYGLQKDAKILMVGCGNSKLSEEMYDDGYNQIISTDISDVVIEQLRNHAKDSHKAMIFDVEDCTRLSYPDETFDMVFDKGTLDALSCDQESETTDQMMREMVRVCKPTGSVVIVSFGELHERQYIFDKSIGLEGYRYELCKKYLSIDAQLTNIMRHISNGLPMQLVMSNKTLLMKAMIEMVKIKKALKEEVIESKVIDWKLFNMEDIEDQDCQEKTEQERKENEKGIKQEEEKDRFQEDEKHQGNEDNNDKSNKEDNNKSKEEDNENQEEEEEEEKGQDDENEEEEKINEGDEKEQKQTKKFRRQAQCFIYRIQRNQVKEEETSSSSS